MARGYGIQFGDIVLLGAVVTGGYIVLKQFEFAQEKIDQIGGAASDVMTAPVKALTSVKEDITDVTKAPVEAAKTLYNIDKQVTESALSIPKTILDWIKAQFSKESTPEPPKETLSLTGMSYPTAPMLTAPKPNILTQAASDAGFFNVPTLTVTASTPTPAPAPSTYEVDGVMRVEGFTYDSEGRILSVPTW